LANAAEVADAKLQTRSQWCKELEG